MIDNKEIAGLRRNYTLKKLSAKTVDKSPFVQFKIWLNDALNSSIIEPNAMSLATCGEDNVPSIRTVLLKGITDNGFIFYSNYNSKKGTELEINSNASIHFFWRELERQISISGIVSKLGRGESEEYFNSRPEESRIAAWASPQSKIIKNRKEIENNFIREKEKYSSKTIPMPEFWGGYILNPLYFEFWQGRENRLHDRICYKKNEENWELFRLAP
jgi:pyridoxamine 5'-phosphate oxidase